MSSSELTTARPESLETQVATAGTRWLTPV
jgi:hypothetical protein